MTSCPTQRSVEPPSSLSLEIPHDESQPLVTSEATPSSENNAKEIGGLEMVNIFLFVRHSEFNQLTVDHFHMLM